MSENGSPKDKEQFIEEFGANSWFVEYLFEEYKDNPAAVPEQWKKYFSGESGEGQTTAAALSAAAVLNAGSAAAVRSFPMPQPLPGDSTRVLAGGAAKIIQNMESSLSIPTATSVRTIAVKILEENRLLINSFRAREKLGKVSFTHIIGWAIVQATKKYPVMNNAYSEKGGKPILITREHINLGLAIDIQRRDGSRNLMVPNIKAADKMGFKEFLDAYEDLVKRSRLGQIDPSEFVGTTITLTNPGTLGTISSNPRLMVGQGTIVATGAIQYPAQFVAMSPEAVSNLGLSKVMTITSTYDHRIIQGAESGLFLGEISAMLMGENDFYEGLFDSLGIPQIPHKWQKDNVPAFNETVVGYEEIAKQGRVRQMINMFRVRGHLIATTDPLGNNNIYHKELDPQFHELTVWDYDRLFLTHDFGGVKTATLRQILDKLQNTYCKNIGAEYMHIQSSDEKTWLQNKMEPEENKPNFDHATKKQILNKLIEAENFEHFIHTRFIGHKRFSLEGLEATIPALDYLLTIAADNNVREIVLGMAHRGRLNVLTNIVGKSYESILAEFEDIVDPESTAGSGDVKYHLGATNKVKTRFRREIGVSIASNPSHLEWVNPVVEGIVRSKQTRANDTDRRHIIPVLLHGDSAFAGQGVVAETINLSQLAGYKTGGTIHIVTNNQIGFTTTPEEARSSVYATDVARIVQAPVFHVNGDDPESVLHCIKIAFEYRQKFKKDVVVDIVGYRRHGHNEGDDPGYTQPILYAKIKQHESVTKIYAQKLVNETTITSEDAENMRKAYIQKLEDALQVVVNIKNKFSGDILFDVNKEAEEEEREVHNTAVSEEVLNEVLIKGSTLPEGFHLHPKLVKFLEKRKELALSKDGLADWATAEFAAFATLLKEKTPVRLSGQDCVRGTFTQRHMAFSDVQDGHEYFPINHIYNDQAKAEILDSNLSEAAVLGFEYGYSTADPKTLVIWEAQFGDFANSAQVIIDNFIVASKEKWNTPNNVVLLLPHGFEGQGPEHSSARPERYLILCAEGNMEVCHLSDPANYFHLLRRQMKKDEQRPLLVMTPKSLLRLPEARSPKQHFLSGSFREFIDDDFVADRSNVRKIMLTAGKIYYELDKFRKEHGFTDVAIIRVEQYYPFESELLKGILDKYPNFNEVFWVQEEPRNMGGWTFLNPRIDELLEGKTKVVYIGRPASASPAVGSYKLSNMQQDAIIRTAFTML
ncbi:MAG: multifunctional oxoglutarate decarboxylase/oxoglutarate dehydrogenase thiamine pyrophosphate-binding subunit/dihydrolipoyllysine-residue succinyltransferase subunit [Ignavibacteriales bacterium]|nr:Multifunctional 2-oxoglutarate metabolism enzyme [Ignavibacteriaceae bacterium]MBZ0195870.1 multifunctional oxoglutarate decarboxylase/oxoglutarate dehydrogenase thiamine pyrophosphate-binding subunit/dihydrolipoyllysine-residue succinyltransferase subunit [Ignavibacteriaceae bacterium]MCZ2142330.1 multifunctional oxoglutarate decarboxylase/oxoglutarate dehydrogenase thiamine pyrophosphate-binding subunit/dihydrolipoyllysine-residue succinyltransferase subunit [Ignavibacteriales bacterium]